jgi:hypothetical protein
MIFNKDEKKEVNERLCGIFNVQGIKNKNQVIVKHLENMKLKSHEYVPDTLIKSYDIIENVTGEIYTCNITDSFLMKTNKLPLMYVSVIYDIPLRRVLLFRTYLYFTIQSDVKNTNQLLNNPLNGKFSIELSLEGSLKEIDNKIDKYYGDEVMQEKLSKFTVTDEMKEIVKGMIDDIHKKIAEQYADELAYYSLPEKYTSLKDNKELTHKIIKP